MNKQLLGNQRLANRPLTDKVSKNGRPAGLSILLIDDNPAVARAMEIAFGIAGHHIDTAVGPEEAFSYLCIARHDAILLDMNFTAGQSSGDEGLTCLARIIAENPAACVVVLTAHSGIRIAVAAMQAGARDFAMKPWRNAELVAKVEAAVARGSSGVTATLPNGTDGAPVRLLGESTTMHRLRDLVRRVGPTSASITVTGPSGAGRSMTAYAIHANSLEASATPLRVDLRDQDAWSRLDCAVGTVILRYPDQLDAVAQVRLLERLPGAIRCIAIASATVSLVPALQHRIATVEVEVPPLRDRGNDVVLLARHFARVAGERFGRPDTRLSKAAEAAIFATDWLDEVRGLALAIERAVLLTDSDAIDAAAFALPASASIAASVAADGNFDLTDAERTMIQAALREHRHNVTHAAAALGLSRGALYRRMARHGF